MSNTPVQYPFFNLIQTEEHAELALSVLTEYGNPRSRLCLDLRQKGYSKILCVATVSTAVNKLLAMYLEAYGEFSDELMIFLSKSLVEQKLTKAAYPRLLSPSCLQYF